MIYLIDNESGMLKKMEKFINEILKEDVQSKQYSETTKEKIEKDLASCDENDFLIIDLYLYEQKEAREPYSEFQSVRLAKNSVIKKKNIMFYSVNNTRTPDDLFCIIKECSYLSMFESAWADEDSDMWERKNTIRKEYGKQIKEFLDK